MNNPSHVADTIAMPIRLGRPVAADLRIAGFVCAARVRGQWWTVHTTPVDDTRPGLLAGLDELHVVIRPAVLVPVDDRSLVPWQAVLATVRRVLRRNSTTRSLFRAA